MRARAGFTLIELLVSAVLLASVTAGVTMVLSTSLNAWRAGQERDGFSQQAQAILDTITRDVQASFLGRKGFLVSSEEEQDRYALDCTTLSRRMLRLLYASEKEEPLGENLSDHAQVVYFTQAGENEGTFALYRQEVCPPTSQPLQQEERDTQKAQLLSDRVASFKLRCYDGQDWLDAWDSLAEQGQRSLPAAIEIALTLVEGERKQAYITRVRVVTSQVAAAQTAPNG
jgi:prepilin-type N-terminal cleavage/methylation domain-containing protein